MPETRVVILGAGLSGLSAAAYLRTEYEIFEKEEFIGGLCRSRHLRGFTFDIAGHLLHFQEKKTKAFIMGLLGNTLRQQKRKSWIWSHGSFIPYPFQVNFMRLPRDVARECSAGLAQARKKQKNVNDASDGLCFKAWVLATFGEGIARHFMLPYNEKFWKFSLEQLNHEWAREWIPIGTKGYNAEFWYPRCGGIQTLADALAKRGRRVRTRCEAMHLDLRKKEVLFSNGIRYRFNKVISTIPLPEMIRLITPLPESVRRALLDLRYTSLFNVNLGLSKKLKSGKHWIYFPQKDISFYRLGISTNFSESMAPPGCSSVYFEASYTKDAPIDKKKALEAIYGDCLKIGFPIKEEDVKVVDCNDIKYGYCVYDRKRDAALAVIQDYLKKHDIFSIGRYGGWRYASMEDVIAEARDIVTKIEHL
ncbi:MAG: FAD-dependent oxidoreductase [Candidatus Omnitrophota bacterium]